MTRTLALAALGLLLATPGAAQLDAPSKTEGFFVGASLVGASFDTDADDDVDAYTGGGAGIELGYGFSSGLALFLGFDAGTMDGDDADFEIDRRGQVDLGVRMNFGGGRRALVPYFEAAITALVLEVERDLQEPATYSGGGLSLGGGVQYFLSHKLSLNGGVRATFGALTEVEIDGEDREEIGDQHFTTSRLLVGLTWHP